MCDCALIVLGPGPDRGVVFQSHSVLPNLTALGNVMLAADQVYPHAKKSERIQVANYYLERVGLADHRSRYPSELSGGMRQRVGVARAFALSPRLLLLDEPFGSLDFLTRFELQRVLLEVRWTTKTAAFMVTHDIDEALFLADRIVLMTDAPAARVGEIVEVPFSRPRAIVTRCWKILSITDCASSSSVFWIAVQVHQWLRHNNGHVPRIAPGRAAPGCCCSIGYA